MILSRVLLAPFIVVMMVCATLVYFFAVNIKNDVLKIWWILQKDIVASLRTFFQNERAT
jgi:hypothetical protein